MIRFLRNVLVLTRFADCIDLIVIRCFNVFSGSKPKILGILTGPCAREVEAGAHRRHSIHCLPEVQEGGQLQVLHGDEGGSAHRARTATVFTRLPSKAAGDAAQSLDGEVNDGYPEGMVKASEDALSASLPQIGRLSSNPLTSNRDIVVKSSIYEV